MSRRSPRACGYGTLPYRSFELLPPCVLWFPAGTGSLMGEKLTPLKAHLMRKRVLVYLVNSCAHTQVPTRVFVSRAGPPVDVGIARNPAQMAGIRTWATPAT